MGFRMEYNKQAKKDQKIIWMIYSNEIMKIYVENVTLVYMFYGYV